MSGGQRLRAWVLAGRLLIALVCLMIVVGTMSNQPIPAVLLAVVVVGLTGSFLTDPRRSWWGPEPSAVLADPLRRRAWRKRELPVAVVIFLAIVVGLPAVWTYLAR